MSETATLRLPLLMAAQAQKHVTMNDALVRLDAVAQLSIASRALTAPPANVSDGAVYAVPVASEGPWSGQTGRLAHRTNGGWVFLDPRPGWRGWIEDEGVGALFDGVEWAAGPLAVSAAGASLGCRIIEVDHAVNVGTESRTTPIIPAMSVVVGVTGRVLEGLGGSATSFRVGTGPDANDRYGSGISLEAGAWFRGLTSAPLTYYTPTALTFTAEGGSFGTGTVRVAVHLLELGLPRV